MQLNRRFGSWSTRLLVVLVFIVLTLVFTYPLVLYLRTAVPGPPWDNFEWLYHLWWFRHSVVDLGQWPTVDPTIFYPFGYDLRLSESMWANFVLIAPFLFWFDEVVAYNIFVLLTFVLTGYATYLLIAYLTDNRLAATIGGAIFAFCPYRMHVTAAGWLPLLSTQWIPLLFLYLERFFRERRLHHALLAGLFMALTALSSWYYAYIVGLFVIVFVLVRLWPWGKALRDALLVRGLLLAAVVVLAFVLPVALPLFSMRSGELRWSLADVDKWSASADDFLLPNVYHPWWGEFFLSMRSEVPSYPWYLPGCIYLGIAALALALVAVLKRYEEGTFPRGYGWVMILSLVLALGVVLRWNGAVLQVAVPAKIEALFNRIMSSLVSKWALNKDSYYAIPFAAGNIPIPLPGMLIYLFLPWGHAMRTLYRFGVMTIFGVTVLAGIGAARLLGACRFPDEVLFVASEATERPISQRPLRPGRTLALGGLLLALVLADFVSAPLPFGVSLVGAQSLERWLAAQPEDTVVMQFPLIRALNGTSLYRTKYHGKRVAYGHGTFFPPGFRYAMPVLETFPDKQCLSLLTSWGVTHIAVGSQVYDAGWGDQPGQTWDSLRQQIEASPRLYLVGVTFEEPFWVRERVSAVIRGDPPVEPILVDKVYLYELRGE